MAGGHRHAVLQHLRSLVGGQRSDSELLACFVMRRDPAAFAALVRRHGPMVLGVCRRVLRHEQDAEDACQAAWLVLARKAGSIRKHQSVSSWLHGVAYRVAMNLKRQIQRHRAVDGPGIAAARSDPVQELTWREVRSALDKELERLPERLRAPIVLCYLEGKTRDEAAAVLGWTPGALRGRLERGRLLLRARLGRCGLALSTTLIATALAEDARAAGLPLAVSRLTIEAATRLAAGEGAISGLISARVARLAQGVIQTMLLSKLKGLTACALVMGLVVGGGVLGYRTAGAQAQPLDPQQDRAPATALAEPVAESWRETATLQVQQPTALAAPVLCLDFSPDGKRLAVGAADGTVTVYDPATGRIVFKIQDGGPGRSTTGPIWSVKFAPNGKWLAVAGENKIVRVWDSTGKLINKESTFAGPVFTVSFSPDGRRLAAGCADNSVRIWSLDREKVILSDPRGGTSVAFSPDGRLLAMGQDGGAIVLWDSSSGRELRRLGHADLLPATGHSAVAFSPDGKLLAAVSNETAVRLWDIATGKEMAQFGGLQRYVPSVALSPDGRRVASGSVDSSVHVWDVTGREIASLKGHRDAVTSVAFSPDGKLLASGSRDGTVKLWQLPVHQSLHQEANLGPIGRKPGVVADAALEKLVAELARRNRPDGEAIDALYLATLARYPTETEKQFAAQALVQKERLREALEDVLSVLVKSKEFQARVAAWRDERSHR
jgi:RNA polymerase sigma factor (sigma-70 family)